MAGPTKHKPPVKQKSYPSVISFLLMSVSGRSETLVARKSDIQRECLLPTLVGPSAAAYINCHLTGKSEQTYRLATLNIFQYLAAYSIPAINPKPIFTIL